MFELHNYRFMMLLGFGQDLWTLHGRVFGRYPEYFDGEPIHVSTPVHLDRDHEILTTHSGSKYKLMNPDGNKEDIFDEIEETIQRGCYTVR